MLMLRKTENQDIPKVLKILEAAKTRMKDVSIPQWQSGYPNEESIIDDIGAERSYVYVVDGEIVATAVLDFEKDPNYRQIDDGAWIDEELSYASIHRIATSDKMLGQGIGKKLIQALLENARQRGVDTVRVDTHALNTPMRKLVEANGFEERGIIYIAFESNSPRIAYEIKI